MLCAGTDQYTSCLEPHRLSGDGRVGAGYLWFVTNGFVYLHRASVVSLAEQLEAIARHTAD